jgi:uncharacterized protein
MFCRKLVSVFFLSLATGHSLCRGATQSPEGQTTAEPPFFATSFDCSKATVNSTEEAICKNEELAKLDNEMAAAYRKRLGTVPAEKRAAVIESQKL